MRTKPPYPVLSIVRLLQLVATYGFVRIGSAIRVEIPTAPMLEGPDGEPVPVALAVVTKHTYLFGWPPATYPGGNGEAGRVARLLNLLDGAPADAYNEAVRLYVSTR